MKVIKGKEFLKGVYRCVEEERFCWKTFLSRKRWNKNHTEGDGRNCLTKKVFITLYI